MPMTLHAALIPGWLQVLGAARGLIDKARDHCAAHDLPEAELVQARLIDDMLPFAYQIKSCAVHTRGAIEGVRKGTFSPDMSEPPATFAALAERLDETIAFLAALDSAELEGFHGKDMAFTIGERFRREYTAENFLLGFSQPNFFFHAATAYDILRMKGVKIGKVDFLGATPVKG
jgi:hypothetical protein